MQNLDQLLANPLFQPILKKAQYINQLNHSLHKVLTADLSDHCCIADIEGPCLILQVNNSAWATRLRYQTPQLLTALKTHRDFANIESIRWRVNAEAGEEHKKTEKNVLGCKQAEIIKDLLMTSSQNISNKKLKASLEKLAEHINR